jgi:hypothetical protein
MYPVCLSHNLLAATEPLYTVPGKPTGGGFATHALCNRLLQCPNHMPQPAAKQQAHSTTWHPLWLWLCGVGSSPPAASYVLVPAANTVPLALPFKAAEMQLNCCAATSISCLLVAAGPCVVLLPVPGPAAASAASKLRSARVSSVRP